MNYGDLNNLINLLTIYITLLIVKEIVSFIRSYL